MVQIVTPANETAERKGCGTCAAAQLMDGGHTLCRRNPPGRGPTGAPLWPQVDPNKDWCTQWLPTSPD